MFLYNKKWYTIPLPSEKDVVFFCEVCKRKTAIEPVSRRFPGRSTCKKCRLYLYEPFTPLEWKRFRQNSLELRSGRVYRKLKSWEMLGGLKQKFDYGESSSSILVKINLEKARNREIKEEEKTTCAICFDENLHDLVCF